MRHEAGKWFKTADGVEWGDNGVVELRTSSSGVVTRAVLQVDEFFTGEDEIPQPSVRQLDGTPASFFDFEEWRYPA